MGGDHKCPVCQATFTRPQHVARHMRSHTGDRPYKCQYCGDQFARSDLLARHINKCHANEKPPATAIAGGRRKGSVAASRATTSKQACDQCVQSSLPCDGSNPCSKCVSRKSRCTYIKFHRQTAPSGPGHHAPRSPSSSSSSLCGGAGPSNHLDAFPLAPPPVAPAPFPGPDQIFNTPFTFNPAAPAYPPSWATADVAQIPFSMVSDVDASAKHVDYLRRAGPSILSNSPTTALPNLYPNQPHQAPSSNWYSAWTEPGTYPALDDTKPFDGIARTHSLTSSEPASFAPEFYGAGLIGSAYRPRKMSLDFSDSSSATSQSVPSSATSSSVHLPLPGSENLYDGSEELPRHAQGAHMLPHQRRDSVPTSQLPPFSAPPGASCPPPTTTTTTQQPHRQGSFSSAFGLMSIDDPSVLAGLTSPDGVPFFSTLGMSLLPHSPNATPMPTRVPHAHGAHPARDRGLSLGALPTPGLSNKDAGETRELKDMWKTFLRSPLSGSGSGTLDLPSLGQMPQSPSGRRRMRVSSLPSVTPTVEKGQPLMANEREGVNGNAVRTTMHGNGDDLRSYEAAVNARNASSSLKLNLVPRHKATGPSLRASSPQGLGEDVSSFAGAGAGQGGQQGISRPSSSSSTSSFAQAFTVTSPPHHHHHHHHHQHHHHHPLNAPNHHAHMHGHGPGVGVVKPPPMQGASISLPVPPPSMSLSGMHSTSHAHHAHSHSYGGGVGFGSSTSLTFEPGSRASSVTSDGTGTGGSGSDGEAFRPSFKRYASQTLGPPSSKRAMVERGNGRGETKNVKVDKGVKGGGGGGGTRHGNGDDDEDGMVCFERGVGGRSPGSRPIAALPERAKRV